MLANLLKLDGAGTSSFSDADDIASWAQASVSSLVAAGIMIGYPDGSFRPQEVITRAEAVVMINKALAYQSPTPVTDQLQVTGDDVNVRSDPSMSAPVIGQANSGDILQAEAENDDDWYQIDYQGGSGWIAGWYVQVCQPSLASQASDTAPSNSSQTSNSTVSDSTPGTHPWKQMGLPGVAEYANRAERRRERGEYPGNTDQHSVCRQDMPTKRRAIRQPIQT